MHSSEPLPAGLSAERVVEDHGADQVFTVDTPVGPGRLYLYSSALAADSSSPTLALGHGAGGGIATADLQAIAARAASEGCSVVLVEQPWRVAGRRVATAPPTLDRAFVAAVTALRAGLGLGGPLVVGGRSAGARVACRTASELKAQGVLCLAFPLHPPGRPEKSRIAELALATADHPVLVVQGARDAFGSASEVSQSLHDATTAKSPANGVDVVEVPGDHSLKAAPGAVADAVVQWLRGPVLRGS